MRALTEKEHEEMVQHGEEFWREFSALCHKYLDKPSKDLREIYKAYLGEKTSIYGIANKRE